MTALIVMACSGKKHPGAERMPAIDRYQGPMWGTLRAALNELGEAEKPEVWFLSAKYGFHPASLGILDYEQKLTEHRARDLLSNPNSNWREFAQAAHSMDRIMLAGGFVYRDAMRRAIGKLPMQGASPLIAETDGGGIGHHRAQLRQWISGVAEASAKGEPEQLSLF